MRRYLEYLSNQIEAVLTAHHVPARVTGGLVTPRWVRFELVTALPAQVGKIADLEEELARRLGGRNCRVCWHSRGTIQVEVPREKPGRVRLLPLCHQLSEVPPCTAVLGLEEEGVPLLLRLSSPDVAHVLIAGTTGSGKTALARTMALSLTTFNRQAQVQLALIGAAFGDLGGLPHLVPLADVAALGDELHRRMWDGSALPRLVVFVDGLDGLAEEELDRLSFVLDAGPDYGVHVVASTARPLPELTWAFPVRVVGAVETAEEARQMVAVELPGAERLLGQGDFLLLAREMEEPVRFQAAWVSAEETARSVEEAKSRDAAVRERV